MDGSFHHPTFLVSHVMKKDLSLLHLFSLDQRKEFSSHSLTTSSSAAIHTQLLVVNYEKLIPDKRLIGN